MQGSDCKCVIALLGAPNSGKTTLFNRLTGSSSMVANWPGATIAIDYSKITIGNERICLVDLPGVYSVKGASAEERVTREFISRNKPDAVIVLADSTNLERSLYLPLEVLELYDNVVIALTKIDQAKERGISVDVKGLSETLGVPVVEISALQGIGLSELKELMLRLCKGRLKLEPRIELLVPPVFSEAYNEIRDFLVRRGLSRAVAERLALQLILNIEEARSRLKKLIDVKDYEAIIKKLGNVLGIKSSAEIELDIITDRYNKISKLYSKFVKVKSPRESEVKVSKIDTLYLHPVIGPVISFATLLSLFTLAYLIALGSPLDIIARKLGLKGLSELISAYNPVSLTASFMDWLAEKIAGLAPDPRLADLLSKGIFSSGYGVGLVVSFIPLIGVFMALVAMVEDSGLLPRIAAGMDKVFRRFGVSGKAVFPALISFGCNVPGVLSTRIMDTYRERIAVIMAAPFIPCTARYTVIMAFSIAYFHGVMRIIVAFTVYMIAILLHLLTIRLVTRIERVEATELILELPRLKTPSLRVVWWLTWDKLKHFIVRAGTIIMLASIALWFLSNYGPKGYVSWENVEDSYAALVGRKLSGYAKLVAGVDDDVSWRIGFSLLNGLVAKEVFLDSLAAVSPAKPTEEGHVATLKAYKLEPYQSIPLLILVTLYMPCIATLASIYAETRSLKITSASLVYSIAVATLLSITARLVLEFLF
ncbi:MAG: ferrous iron transport protein B [Hyperthermus sp.]|nr:MAG: ferrous iron transport protein B [Hyperthermus sp.]